MCISISRVFCEKWGFRDDRLPTRLTTDRHQALKAWIAAVLWLIVIAIESTKYLSAHNTSRFLFPALHYLFGMSLEQFQPIHFYMRKGGHALRVALGVVEHPPLSRLARNPARPRKSCVDLPLGDHCRARNCTGGEPRRVAPELPTFAHRHAVRTSYSTPAPESALRFLCCFGYECLGGLSTAERLQRPRRVHRISAHASK